VFSQSFSTVTVQASLMQEVSLGNPKLCSGCNNTYYFHLFLVYLTTSTVSQSSCLRTKGRLLERFGRDPITDTLKCSWRDNTRPPKGTQSLRQVAVNLDTSV
jgi:hypothetical protein